MNLRRLLLLTQLPFWVLLIVAFLLLGRALDARVNATLLVERTHTELAQVSRVQQAVLDMETGLRGYVITNDRTFLEPYEQARAALPGHLRVLNDLALRHGRETAQYQARVERVETLVRRWQAEVAAPEIQARQRSEAAAAAIVKTRAGKNLMDAIRVELTAYANDENGVLATRLNDADTLLEQLRQLAVGVMVLGLLTSTLAVLFGASVVTRSFEAVTRAARRLTAGERGVQLRQAGLEEVQTLTGAFNHMSAQLTQASEDARVHTEELAQRNTWMRDLGDLSDWMQAARSLEEGGRVLERALPHLLPGTAGTLLHHNASRNLLLPLISWGGPPDAGASPDHCWALRRGEMRSSGDHNFTPPCLNAPGGAYTCVPLFSHGETLGIMRLRAVDGGDLPPGLLRAVPAVARQVALALAGLRLQERLRQLSIRDPLTGLFNRRHLEDELNLHFPQAVTAGVPLSLIALDVDHFKRLNDTFGHEAGDAALVRLGAALTDIAPVGSTPARPGGEEFALLLPGYDLTAATALAEALREQVADWTLSHSGISLGRVTVSIGVAQVDARLMGPEALVRAADEALYAAKREGRNRVVQATGALPVRVSQA